MYVRTIQRLNYGGQESKEQCAVYDSDTPVTLKQSQGHQTWFELVDPEQGYDNAKFKKKPHLTVSVKKPTIKVLSNQETCKLPSLNMDER